MAELTTDPTPATSACCAPEAQASCCEPSEKDACCGAATAGESCGCSAGRQPASSPTSEPVDIRETVREKYAAAGRVPGHAGGPPQPVLRPRRVCRQPEGHGPDDRVRATTRHPTVLVNGDIVMHGRYPSREQLAGVLDLVGESGPPASPGGCGCRLDRLLLMSLPDPTSWSPSPICRDKPASRLPARTSRSRSSTTAAAFARRWLGREHTCAETTVPPPPPAGMT